jgi:hypothetical protein
MPRLKKAEIIGLAGTILGVETEQSSGNWISVSNPASQEDVYVSQCKSSSTSKGNWVYDFFHTLGFEVVQEICRRSGILLLLNYEERKYAILDGADLVWVVRYSSRTKSNQGPVCDFVIDRERSAIFQLRPYDRMKLERRTVEVIPW